MLFHFQNNVEVAVRAAVRARLAFTADAQPRAGVHSRRNAKLNSFLVLDPALTAAIGAAFLDDLSGTLASRASSRNGEKSLLVSELAAPAAGLTGHNPSSRFRAGSVA